MTPLTEDTYNAMEFSFKAASALAAARPFDLEEAPDTDPCLAPTVPSARGDVYVSEPRTIPVMEAA